MERKNIIHCPNGHIFSSRRHGTICPYCNMETASRDVPETAGRSEQEIEELLFAQEVFPVTGWLVCVSGSRQGRAYEIKSGKNFVGRADDMDIRIVGDNKISLRNHAVLVFDPKNKETMLLPGDSNGLVYHDDKAVYNPEKLSSYDLIEMGNSKFLFVAFCGDRFMWNDTGDENGGDSRHKQEM